MYVYVGYTHFIVGFSWLDCTNVCCSTPFSFLHLPLPSFSGLVTASQHLRHCLHDLAASAFLHLSRIPVVSVESPYP